MLEDPQRLNSRRETLPKRHSRELEKDPPYVGVISYFLYESVRSISQSVASLFSRLWPQPNPNYRS